MEKTHLPRFADYSLQDYITLRLKKFRWLEINVNLFFILYDDEPDIHLYFLQYIVEFFHCKHKMVLFNATKYGYISCVL